MFIFHLTRTREISILSNMKMFLNYNVSDRGDDVIRRSRMIFNVLTMQYKTLRI